MFEDAATARQFAVQVVQKLRNHGFESLWAGGCVRDNLLGITPKDYDVATNATPQQVIEVFGPKKTIPVGVSFGVVMVLGPARKCGQVEVATFRADGEYTDGRRPVSVSYCSAEEDAKRRDFTINGMFYDPLADEVIDYVGGQEDLSRQILRAIGTAQERFAEDKLRMLRAVRFAATYGMQLEPNTSRAILKFHDQLNQVSAERIAQELRGMFRHPTRGVSWHHLRSLKLVEVLFPDLPINDNLPEQLNRLTVTRFEPSLAAILSTLFQRDRSQDRERVALIAAECRKLKLSNDETNAICWIINAGDRCHGATSLPLHVIKPILADKRRDMLLDYLRATARDSDEQEDVTFLASYAAGASPQMLDPPPLVNGRDLMNKKISAGPLFTQLLQTIRNEQLDELLVTREAALTRLDELYHH